MPQPPTPDAMRAVGALCANLAKAYYVGECARHAAKTLPGRIEAAEPGFKAGIFSEFHGDWGGAWRMYKTAYDGLVAAHVAAEAAGGAEAGCGMATRPAALKTQLAAPKPSAPCRRGSSGWRWRSGCTTSCARFTSP